MSITISTSIPPKDKPEFSGLKDDCRKEIHEWLRACADILAAPRRGQAIAAAARRFHVSEATVRRKFDEYRHSGDWRVFINRAKYPANSTELPEAFIAHWKKLCEENNRKCEPAWRELIRQWKRGDKMPGYEFSPAPDPVTHVPVGWSYRNLMRYKPSRFELCAMREGLGTAMAKYGPQILTTRVGLWVGSHFIIDDVTRDIRVMLLGHGGQVAKIQELGCLDLFSADRFAVHRRPEFTRDSDGKKDRIKESEMRCFMAAILRNTGISPRGTEAVIEGGTATIRKPLRDWLTGHFPTLRFRLPGDTGKEQAIAGYWGRGGGNPRHKTHLESHHNLLHNEAGFLPAPTGHDRSYPEFLAGLEAITEGVIKSLNKLPPERAALLATPMLEYWQALGILNEIDLRIAMRTDHELEGWEECGHTVLEFRRDLLSDDWLGPQQFLALPPAQQQFLAQAAEACAAIRRVRKLAPREVFSHGMGELVRAEDHVLAMMFADRDLGDDLRVERQLAAGGVFDIQDKDTEPGPMIFEGFAVKPDGSRVRLEERQKYGVVVNVFDRSALWVYGKGGEFIGTAPRRTRVSQLDEEALHVQLGNRSQAKAEMLAPLRERHADTSKLIEAMQEHNERVEKGLPVTREEIAAEKAEQRRIKREAATVNDLLPEPAATQAQEAPADTEEYDLSDLLSN